MFTSSRLFHFLRIGLLAALFCVWFTLDASAQYSFRNQGFEQTERIKEKKTLAPPHQPLLLADALSYDENTEIITAHGHVEVTFGTKKLRANKVLYNKSTGVVQALGQVAMTEESGTILFSDHIELTTDMRQGFIDQVGILFPDNSRLVAQEAQRYAGRYLIADHGIYSSCNLCKDDPTKPPLWQFKGTRITHDSEAKNIIYRDAILEFVGVPVFYTPYFSHPDPTVKRRQGFLTPSGGLDETLGTVVRTPYYFDIAPNSDFLLTPTFTTTDQLQLGGKWRHRFEQGEMKWEGSLARTQFTNEEGRDEGKKFRGHLFNTTSFDLTDKWRGGTELALTTDKSYLPRYDISSKDILINRAYAEYFKGRNYGVINTYYFQDLRPGDRLAEPVVAPEIRYSAFGEPNQTLGGRWSLGGNFLVTSRSRNVAPDLQGPSTRRLALNAGWERQIASSTGFLTTLSALARADGYWADNVPDPDVPLGTGFSNIKRLRPFIQGNVVLRYPLGRSGVGYRQILEPMAMLSVAPRLSAHSDLPNEDSLDVEFDETNLFSPNRFAGTDRIEGGTRLAYGLRHAIIADNGASIEMIGGQVFRLNRDDSFPESSGLATQRSDYVGRIDMSPAPWLNLDYGFRLDQNDLTFSRQNLSSSLGPEIFRPNVGFLSSEQINLTTNQMEQVEELAFGFNSHFAKYWRISALYRQAMSPAPGPRSADFSLTYQDECFTTGITASQDYTDRLDISAGRSILFHFYLKNIGGLSTQ